MTWKTKVYTVDLQNKDLIYIYQNKTEKTLILYEALNVMKEFLACYILTLVQSRSK